MAIKVLDSTVVSKIAAGEVIERPASVVKELLENSLDAGATQIAIEVGGDGTQLIRITDNGSGILADEVELAFERHATSKITSEADIETISSLGFRGEALPTIASVADVSIVTKHRDEVEGTALRLENGSVVSKRKQGAPNGTAITVKNLFRAVPARLKFLKSVSTENSHISHLVIQYSLAFPEVKFDLTINSRKSLRSPGNGKLHDALVEVYGLQTAQSMLEIHSGEESDTQNIAVNGFVSPSSVTRSNRNYLSFFVNRRWVQSRMLNFAVEEAYQGMMMAGKHPIAVISISIPPEEIDVNVHPTKSEIRFRREREVFSVVQKAVRSTLVGYSPVPTIKFPQHVENNVTSTTIPFPITGGIKSGQRPVQHAEIPKVGNDAKLPIMRIIGQFQNTYILTEGPDGMYIVDQHAAHERVLFEKVRQQEKIEVQGLLEPRSIDLTAQQSELISSHGEKLLEAGFILEQFGERTFLLRAVPALIKQQDILAVLSELLDSLSEMQASNWRERIAASLACHGAIKAGQTLNQQEMEELINQLEETTSPRTCPHGRPTMLQFSASQLESEFGRKG